MPLYEYTCPTCAGVFSRLQPLAVAGDTIPCPRCGTAATRTLAPFAVHRRREAPAPAAPQPTPTGPQLCQQYPYIPLLCHMEPQAAQRLIAKAEGREEQYLEREAGRQEAAVRAGRPPTAASADASAVHVHHAHAHAGARPEQTGHEKIS